jgi:hypothetical protein
MGNRGRCRICASKPEWARCNNASSGVLNGDVDRDADMAHFQGLCSVTVTTSLHSNNFICGSIRRFSLPYELTFYQFIDDFNRLYSVVDESVAAASGNPQTTYAEFSHD